MENNIAYVILEDWEDETSVIGVSSTPEKALDLVKEYYGEYEEIWYKDVRESGIEWLRKIKVKDDYFSNSEDPFDNYVLTLMWYTVDKV